MALEKLQINWLDGDETVVTPCLLDTRAAEAAAKSNPQWGTVQQAPMTIAQFKAFNAAKREPGTHSEQLVSFDAFSRAVNSVTIAEENDGTDENDVLGLGLDTPTDQPATY